jgi:hypothetical protein
MYLTFPPSMIIPEALERLEDPNFEEWLTAALIESASQAPSEQPDANGGHYLARGITDLWMLEIAERNGEIWTGKFQAELNGRNGAPPQTDSLTEHRSRELAFALDTRTAEITFHPIATESDLRPEKHRRRLSIILF